MFSIKIFIVLLIFYIYFLNSTSTILMPIFKKFLTYNIKKDNIVNDTILLKGGISQGFFFLKN